MNTLIQESVKHHEPRKFPITPNQMRLPRLRQTVRRLVERPMANPRQIRRTRENGQRQTLLHKPPRHHAQPHSGRLIPSTRQYAKRLAHLGRRIHVPQYTNHASPPFSTYWKKPRPTTHSPTNLSKNARSHYSERIRTGLKTIRRNMKYSTCGNSRCLAFRNSF